MLLALLLMASVADWVPMRWTSADPNSLELLKGTPINCLLLERESWSRKFNEAAAGKEIATLGVVRSGSDLEEIPAKAGDLKLTGIVLEGDFVLADAERIRRALSDSKLVLIELPSRVRMRFDTSGPVVGTYQGIWPGIHADEDSTKAAPSGAPWIDTNSGFLRFVRAMTGSPIWIGHTPPTKTVITSEHYSQAICDAAMVGARWILALDENLSKRLHAGEAEALKDWKIITQQLAHFESHKEWRAMQPVGQLALVQDVDSGALFSGGILDMIAVKHTPVLPVPKAKLSRNSCTTDSRGAANSAECFFDLMPRRTACAPTGETMKGKMAVNVDPSSLSPEQKEALMNFARRGGTLLNGPPGWKFPALEADQITLDEEDVKFLDDVWQEVNAMTGRRNLGARLFNVSSMLSNLMQSPDGKQTVLHLVNFSGYPVESVTVHLLGEYKQAVLLTPDGASRKLSLYKHD